MAIGLVFNRTAFNASYFWEKIWPKNRGLAANSKKCPTVAGPARVQTNRVCTN